MREINFVCQYGNLYNNILKIVKILLKSNIKFLDIINNKKFFNYFMVVIFKKITYHILSSKNLLYHPTYFRYNYVWYH